MLSYFLLSTAAISPLLQPVTLHRLGRRSERSYRPRQRALFCPCGQHTPVCQGLCRQCYRRRRLSHRAFGGLREAVLTRDGHTCRNCAAKRQLAVHHRVPGLNRIDLLITLCAACHARVHRLRSIRRWLPEFLVLLWAEQHPGTPRQLQFDVSCGRGS